MTRRPQRMKKIMLWMTLGMVALVLHPFSLSAKKIPADQVRISTPVYAPAESFDPRMGKYSYAVSWNGIPAGSVDLELNRTGDAYEIRATARTAKAIDLLFKLRYQAETIVSARTLLPVRSVSTTRANDKKKTTELEFLPGGEIFSVREDHHGKPRTLRFDPDNFTLEPYSLGFLALSQDWKVGESRRFDMFSGKSRYLVEFTAVEEAQVTVSGQSRSSIVLRPSVLKLTEPGEDSEDKKLREARIYISADQPREILKISSDLLFGSVNTEMTGFSPAPPEKPRDLLSQNGEAETADALPSWDGPPEQADFSLVIARYPLIFVEFLTCSSLLLFSHDHAALAGDLGWNDPPASHIRRSFLVYSAIAAPDRNGRKAVTPGLSFIRGIPEKFPRKG